MFFFQRKITLLEDNHSGAQYNYLICVHTGHRKNAGTTANVRNFTTNEVGSLSLCQTNTQLKWIRRSNQVTSACVISENSELERIGSRKRQITIMMLVKFESKTLVQTREHEW